MSFNIDIAILLAFLIATLLVGLRAGKNVKTMRDYALGNRNFSTGALVATMVATYVSGSGFVTTLSKTYMDGFYYLVISGGSLLAFVLVGTVIVPRMGEFFGKLSIAEAMGAMYGKEVRVVTAMSGSFATVGIVAVQFKVFGSILAFFLGIDPTLAIISAGGLVTIYSAFGGIRAVTYTDILQFTAFGVIIPIIGAIIWHQAYGTGFDINAALQNPRFDLGKIISLGNPEFWPMVLLFLYFGIPIVTPIDFQRISMGRSITQVKNVFIITGILLVVIKLIIAWIPFLLYNVNPDIEASQLLAYIIDNYTYVGLKGLIMVAIVAMAMSTADSYINASSVLFANDFCKPLGIIKGAELMASKSFSISLGSCAIGLALRTNDLLSMILFANSFYIPIAGLPFLLSVLGFRSSKISVLIGMGAAFISTIMWKILEIQMDGIVICMLINAAFLIGSHYLLNQPGGWVGVKDRRFLEQARRESMERNKRILNSLASFKFIDFCRRNAPKNELSYTGLGVYFLIFTFTSMYTTHFVSLNEPGKTILTMYQIMLVTGVVMTMYPIWPSRIKKEIVAQVLWHVTIFYMLIFFSGFFIMLSEFNQLQFAVLTANIILSIILLGWRASFITIPIGSYTSLILYKNYMGIGDMDIRIGSPQFMLLYTFLLLGSALVIFLKPKQEQYALAEEKNEHLNERINAQEEEVRNALALKSEFLRNLEHEYHAPMTGIVSMAQVLAESYGALSDEQRQEAAKDIFKSSLRLEQFDKNINSLASLSKAGYQLKLEQVDLSSLVEERVNTCRKLYEGEVENRDFICDIEDGIKVSIDKGYLTQALDNLIINSINYCKEGKIKVSLKQEGNKVIFSIEDEGIGIPPRELDEIFLEFTVSSRTKTQAGGRGVGLALCKRVVEVHGGQISAESDGSNGALFRFALPKS